MILNLKSFNDEYKDQIKKEVSELKKEWIRPTLSIILIWNDKWAEIYSNTKKRIAHTLWIVVEITKFWEDTKQSEITNKIEAINADKWKHWIIVESPTPKHINYDEIIWLIDPLKDVDWLHPNNLWKILWKDISNIIPATPQACIKILNILWEDIKWKNITIVGRWRTVWLPLSAILINMWATITSCNSNTKDLKTACKNADIIITATWQKNLITTDMINNNSIIIDAGIYVDTDWSISWDTDFENVSKIAKYTTPVPWWVGAITTTSIFNNLIQLIKNQKNVKKNDFNLSLDNFIKISKWPDMPWWWWISCISAINWASMISMVASLTKNIDQNKYIKYIDTIIDKLKDLYKQDIETFEEYLNVLKNKAETDEGKIIRKNKIEDLSKKLCYIPIETAKTWIEIIKLWKELHEIGNQNLLSDIYVWINITSAAIKSVLEPIEINTKFIKDDETKWQIIHQKETILKYLSTFNL